MKHNDKDDELRCQSNDQLWQIVNKGGTEDDVKGRKGTERRLLLDSFQLFSNVSVYENDLGSLLNQIPGPYPQSNKYGLGVENLHL